MSPMRGMVTSAGSEFAVRVVPRNVYDHPIAMEVRVYDDQFRPLAATVMPPAFQLAAGASRAVTVLVPFAGEARRRVRVCAESIPYPNQATQIKAQICGRFLASRLQ